MARYAEGDAAAFKRVFEVIAPRLIGFLRRLTGSEDLAHDLFQEALLRLHQARGSFQPGASVLPWAYTIARNVFLDSARARRHRPGLLKRSDDEKQGPEPSAAAEAESSVLANEAARTVQRALAAMSDARREAFVLIRFEGLSVAEAAEIVGVSENAIKLRAFQAYEVIRDELKRDELARGQRP